jgi:hypothetical protein
VNPYKDDKGVWHVDEVPICSTGIEYKLASGPATFTEDMLADAVKAIGDVAINVPRIKLGHSSSYNEALIGDAEQAFGRVENLRLGENNQTILGDYVGVPEWLATVLPNAYPSRSIEAVQDVETVTGKGYELVITAVSLLGVRWPGCSVLTDLPVWYGADIPEGIEVDTAEIAASGGGMTHKNKAEFEAAVDVSLIRRKFYNDGPGKENWQAWIRGERFDNEEGYNLIVDTGDGELSRVPVEVDGNDVKFGDPVLVTEEYPDKAVAASAVLAGMAIADREMVIYASRAESPDQPTREGEQQMDEATRTALVARLGLPEDATPEQINATLATNLLASQEGEEGDGGGTATATATTETPSGDDDDDNGDDDDDKKTGNEVTDGVVTLDRATFDSLKAGSEAALRHERERQTILVAETVDVAVSDGRIPPARREHWKKALSADYQGSKTLLDGLEKGLVPVTERGSSGGSDGEGLEAGNAASLPEDWFPEIAVIRRNAVANRLVVQAKEG